MSLNIKDEKTHRLARELAHLTGGSMTAAVSEAIRERLECVRGKSNHRRRCHIRSSAGSAGLSDVRRYLRRGHYPDR
jgi:hypothetical protein